MLEFLSNNLSTIVVGAILLGIVILVIKSMRNDKKAGKNSCGCGCSGCPNASICHGTKK
ncbi:MAG: FeoB-associated Cys-rich membrane protein [Ruminococcus sp.]|nr:FeoB-associated Cys-rich membrane protein [Ruminococcus sp.]